MDPSSPFASFPNENNKVKSTIVFVMFCTVCHYVWKAPAATSRCINCKGNGECAIDLTSYESDIPIT